MCRSSVALANLTTGPTISKAKQRPGRLAEAAAGSPEAAADLPEAAADLPEAAADLPEAAADLPIVP